MDTTQQATPMTEEWPVYKTYEQLCILVLNGSGSMRAIESGSCLKKAEAVEKAGRELASCRVQP